MGFDGVGTMYNDILHDLAFVVRFGLAFFNLNGSDRAVSQAGAKTVAHKIAYKAGFAVDQLNRAFRAVRYA